MKEAFKLDLIQASSVKLGGDWHTPSDGVVNVHEGIGTQARTLNEEIWVSFNARSLAGETTWRYYWISAPLSSVQAIIHDEHTEPIHQ